MPALYSRHELHLQPELARKVEQLRLEMEQKAGKKVTKNALLVKIIEQFFEKMTCFPEKRE